MQFSIEGLPKVAEIILAEAHKRKEVGKAAVVALVGDLGAGKTTLVQEMARQLAVEEKVTSPTFVIMRTYECHDSRFTTLTHIDAYRLERDEEVKPLKLERVFSNEGAVVCVEWPDRLFGHLPENALQIKLISVGEGMRELQSDEAFAKALQGAFRVV